MYILIDKVVDVKASLAPKDIFTLQKKGKTRLYTKDKDWLKAYKMMLTASKITYKTWNGPIKGWQPETMKEKIIYSFTKEAKEYEIYLEFRFQMEINSFMNMINKVKPDDGVMRFDNPLKITIISANRWWAEEIITLAMARAQKVVLNASVLKDNKAEE